MLKSHQEVIQSRNYESLRLVLEPLPVPVSILFNIELGKTVPSHLEEPKALSHVLLPFINECSDFGFLKDDDLPLARKSCITLS